MTLTRFIILGALLGFLAACGGNSESRAPTEPSATAGATTTSAVASLEERAELLAYDEDAPLGLEVVKTTQRGGAKLDDVVYEAAGRRVAAYLVRPAVKPKAAVLWAHWYGEEANTDRTEFLPDALALARDGVVSLLPQGMFPWQEPVSEVADEDRRLAIEQAIQLRRGLDLLEDEAGGAALGFVGHDYGAMFGALLVADRRPRTYVFMAPDATFSNWFVKYFVRSASKPALDEAFAPLDPVSNVPDAAPASIFFQFAESDRYVPGYVADKLTEAASEPKKAASYGGGHELDTAARKDRLAWLRTELGLTGA